MHKKFISNGAFRNLVRPNLASGIDFERGVSFNLADNKQPATKKKGCCGKWSISFLFFILCSFSFLLRPFIIKCKNNKFKRIKSLKI